MEIQRFDKRPGCSRVVIHNHVAGVTVQALCADPDYLLELALIVATD